MSETKLPSGTLAALRVARDQASEVSLGPAPDAVRLRPRPSDEPIIVDHDNGLVDVDAALTLPALGRLCHARGMMLPLARPLPPLTVQEACARLPIFLDAFVASVDGLTADGAPFSTGRAPRAATGPDLLGALVTSPPLAVAVRARVRVIEGRAARTLREEHVSARDAAARVGELTELGRAFSVEATRLGPGAFEVLALGGAGALPDADDHPETPRFAHSSRARVTGARMLVPGDQRALAEALTSGARVVAAPFMGRVGALVADGTVPRVPRLDDAVAALAAALAGGPAGGADA
jgi:hypothetical protein